jgi:hypothetical protein
MTAPRDRDPGGKQHAQPNGQPETQIIELCIHVRQRALQIGLGH